MSGAVRSIRYSNCLEEISLNSLFDILVGCFVRVRTDDTRIWGKFTKSCSQNKNLPSIFTVYFYRFVQVHFCPLDSGQYFCLVLWKNYFAFCTYKTLYKKIYKLFYSSRLLLKNKLLSSTVSSSSVSSHSSTYSSSSGLGLAATIAPSTWLSSGSINSKHSKATRG